MDIKVNEVKEIVDTLPIGLYAGRRVPCTLDLEAETSYYVPSDDVIVISFPIIAKGLQAAVECEDYTKETAIRSMVYHELSHAILTPAEGMKYILTNQLEHDIFNIFEDERIETLLANYYLDVDFKKQIYYINGGEINDKPSNALEAFYNLVRFRKDFHGLLPKVDSIIGQAKNINRETGANYFPWSEYNKNYKYWDNVRKLYKQVKQYFNDDNKENQSSNDGQENANGITDGITDDGTPISINENDKKVMTDKNIAVFPGFSPKDTFNATFNENIDTEVYETLKAIINQFNRKNNSGNGIKSYSGIINPRNFLNDDYRYFDKKIGVNGNNKFGSLHLNLMLDDSGSYCENCKATNKVIQALIEIEKQNKNFTFDVYFVANDYRKAKNNQERYIKANGGNKLTPELFDLVRTAQKPNTFNYNIVMYDGMAYCRGEEKNFGAYNRNNLTIISSTDNRSAIENYCPNANKIFVNRDYPNYISENIIKALSRAFR